MRQKYFLGANSSKGFYSLYGSFPPADGAFLYIIKAGPGGGKSGFMKKIGAEAEKRGMAVHHILCSGDPASLDGLYIPAMKTAWVDGTSPHAREPRFYGSDSAYIDLSRFMNGGLSEGEINYVNLYTSLYKAQYSDAYKLLSASENAFSALVPKLISEDKIRRIYRRIAAIMDGNKPINADSPQRDESRFFSCISSGGELRLSGEFSILCKQICLLDNRLGAADAAMQYAARLALQRGESIIRCPCPVCPDRLSALILPQSGIAFAESGWNFTDFRRIRLDKLIAPKLSPGEKAGLREAEKLRSHLMALACEKLRAAKDYHDKLEAVYLPHMDFEALSSFTAEHIREIFP